MTGKDEQGNEDEVRRLRSQLEEAYNIIDELDFELESVSSLLYHHRLCKLLSFVED